MAPTPDESAASEAPAEAVAAVPITKKKCTDGTMQLQTAPQPLIAGWLSSQDLQRGALCLDVQGRASQTLGRAAQVPALSASAHTPANSMLTASFTVWHPSSLGN